MPLYDLDARQRWKNDTVLWAEKMPPSWLRGVGGFRTVGPAAKSAVHGVLVSVNGKTVAR